MTDDVHAVRDIAKQQNPDLVEQYQALWRELFAAGAGDDLRVVLWGFLAEKVPVETAKMVALEYTKGLAR